MISSVTVTKFDTVRIVAVGVCAFPVEFKAHSRAALSKNVLIEYFIPPSLGISDQLCLVRRCLGRFIILPSTRQPRAILGADRASLPDRVQWGAAMPAHRCFPARTATNPGLRGTRLRADCRSAGLWLRVPTHRKRRASLGGELMMSKPARAFVI